MMNAVNIWQSYKQERECRVHFLRLLGVCWSGAQSARDNLGIVRLGNQHCANCIGTLSFPIIIVVVFFIPQVV